MPPTYTQWKAEPIKTEPVYIITMGGTRFCTKEIAGLSSAALPYAEVTFSTNHKVKILKAQAEVGDASFSLIDTNQEVTAFLYAHEKDLSNSLVTIKVGAEDMAEADFLTTYWFLQDYSLDDATYKWQFELIDVLKRLDSACFEDIKKAHLKLAGLVSHTATEITLAEAPTGWRTSGFALLNDGKGNVELVSYASIDPLTNTLQGVVRDKYGVDCGLVFDVEESEVIHVWVKYGTPKQIALELATTTEAGGNGAYDLANGDGAGVVVSSISTADIEAAFDDTDHGVHDWTLLFIEENAISSVKEFIETQIFLPCSFTASLTEAGQLTVVKFESSPSTTNDLEGLFNERGKFGLKRNFKEKVNALQCDFDFDVAGDKNLTTANVGIAQSVLRYQKSDVYKIEARGFRGAGGVQFGYPDLGGNDHAEVAMIRIAELYGTPPMLLKVETALRFRDIVPGEGIIISHDALPDPTTAGTRGLSSRTVTVISKQIDATDRNWPVRLDCEARGNIGRVWHWADDAYPATYDAASLAQQAAGAWWANDTTLEPGSDNKLGYYFGHTEQV